MGVQASMEHHPDKLQTHALDDNKPTLPQLHASSGNLQARFIAIMPVGWMPFLQ
jgi:hypothetical protein